MELNYFGTSLTSAGHYFWVLHDDRMECKYMEGFHIFPFNPEDMLRKTKRGDTKFFNFKGYSIWYIEGAPSDDRPGSKTVFWVKDNLDSLQLLEIIKNHPMAKRILDKLKFTVRWEILNSKTSDELTTK